MSETKSNGTHTWVVKERSNPPQFVCAKGVLMEILWYHVLKCPPHANAVPMVHRIREYVMGLGELVTYNDFWRGLQPLYQYSTKCIDTGQSFTAGFKERVRKYKKGQDWHRI